MAKIKKSQIEDLDAEKVKVSSNDTTPGFLNGKLVAGTNVTLVEGNDGGDETLTINASGGGGDMVLADVQTVTGAKTFENLKMILRNVADTFSGLFTNTNTADRTYTLPDKSGTVLVDESVGLAEVEDIFKKVLTNATVTTTQTLDWDAYSGFIFTMTGATTFSDSNLPATPNETQITILMTGDFAATFPAYYKFGGDTYDGTAWNLLAIECKDNTGAAEQVVCIISNLT